MYHDSGAFPKDSDSIINPRKLPHFAVLITTFNPRVDYLDAQLASISKQKGVKVTIYWCDDNSTSDCFLGAKKIFENFPHIAITLPNSITGVNDNFLNLLKEANDPSIDFFAFCDQDDIWHEDKLSRHASALSKLNSQIAASHSKVLTFGENKKSKRFDRCQSHEIATLLAENCVQGCTLVLNNRARIMILSADSFGIFWYDWWIGLLVAASGKLVLLNQVDTYYRLHDRNLIGFQTIWGRVIMYLKRQAGNNIAQAKSILQFSTKLNLLETSAQIEKWIDGHSGPFPRRLRFALFDQRRRKNRLNDLLRRFSDLLRIP